MIDHYRSKAKRLVAGVMSGTSLDAVDVAFVRVSGTGSTLDVKLRGFAAQPLDAVWRERLLAASHGDLSLREAFELHADLGGLYAAAITAAARECGQPLGSIDAVGLHGQTVYHAPRRQPNGVTVQLGSASIVAQRLHTIVVNDFRSSDVAAGGEGAPLVPYCDYALLRDRQMRVNRVALNVGGIANITWLPTGVRTDDLVAFDTGPGNMMIDAAMRALRGEDYDDEGALAATGTPDAGWLARLLDHPYYRTAPPKSAGREQFGEEVGREHALSARAAGMADADIIATLTLLTARTIADAMRACAEQVGDPRGGHVYQDAFRMYAGRGEPIDEVIVGGGGARNRTLMRMLAEELPAARIVPADEHGLPADAKEAIAFAVLANEALCGTPASLPSVTGASRAVVAGAIHLP